MSVEWDKAKRQFERDGKPIPPASVRQFVLDTVESAKSRMESIAKGYTTHRNTAEFYTSMKNEIRNMHSALAMVAQGGREQMDASSFGRVGQRIKSEVEYLRGFERAIANEKLSDAQILARAIQYAQSAYKTYENGVLERERQFGTAYARRVLEEGAQHCADCPELATEEFLDITEVVEIGDSACGGGCRCYLEFADSEAA